MQSNPSKGVGCWAVDTGQRTNLVKVNSLTMCSISYPTGSIDGSWDKEKLQSPTAPSTQASVSHAALSSQHNLAVNHSLNSLQQNHLLPNGEDNFLCHQMSLYLPVLFCKYRYTHVGWECWASCKLTMCRKQLAWVKGSQHLFNYCTDSYVNRITRGIHCTNKNHKLNHTLKKNVWGTCRTDNW